MDAAVEAAGASLPGSLRLKPHPPVVVGYGMAAGVAPCGVARRRPQGPSGIFQKYVRAPMGRFRTLVPPARPSAPS